MCHQFHTLNEESGIPIAEIRAIVSRKTDTPADGVVSARALSEQAGIIFGDVVAVSVDPILLSGPSLGLMVVGIGESDTFGIVSKTKHWQPHMYNNP